MSGYQVDPYGRSPEDRKDAREAVAKVNKDAADNWHDPAWRAAMAAEMTEVIYEGFQHENLLSLLTEVENLGFDDRSLIKEVKGLRAFWIARGGHIEASTLNADVMEITRDTIGFRVDEFEDKLRTNFAETQATLIDLGVQRMDAEINLRLLRLFQAAIPSGSDYYISGSGVSLTTLNTALREVRDESKSYEVSIIGRATMTDQILDELLGASNNGSGFIPETNEQLVKRGVLGTYRGARIITLKNYKDDQDVSFFPANEMYIASRDASKFAFFGGPQSKEFETPDNWYWSYMLRRDVGGAVIRPERLRRIIDTATPA